MKALKITLLIGIFAVLVAGVVGLSVFGLYQAAMKEEKARLQESVGIQAQLIESMARFNQRHSAGDEAGGVLAATCAQIEEAYAQCILKNHGAEVLIGRREGDRIVFLRNGRSASDRPPASVLFRASAGHGEPMRRALMGETGAFVMEDDAGGRMLAAYTPLPLLKLGLVEKVDIADLQAPFLRSGLRSAGGAVVVIILGSLSLLRLLNSLNRLLRERAGEVIEREARLRAILDHAAEGIITINPEGVVESFNPAAERLFGYAAADVIGRNVSLLMPAPYHAEHDGYLARYRQTGKPGIIGIGREVVGLRKDGSTFPMDLAVSEVALQEGLLFTGIVRDITERKKASEKIRDLTQRMGLATQSAGIGIWDFNIETGRLIWDEKMHELYGVSREDFSGVYEAWEKRVHPDDLSCARAGIQEAVAGGKEFHSQFRICRPDGEVRDLQAHSVTLRNADGMPRHIIGANWDITAEKKYKALLEDLNQVLVHQAAELKIEKEHAEESDRLKSAFLAIMSHELRTPLNSIIGFTGIILQGLSGPLTDEQHKQLGMVKLSARHLLELINDILDLSKIEAGQLEIHPAPFSLPDAIEKTVGVIAPLAAKKGLALESGVAAPTGTVVSDRRRVEQILINLANNAIKFTEAGTVRLEGSFDRDQVVLRVSDTGMGIKPGDIPRLFEPFQQIDTGLNRNHEGSGLGLAICAKLARALGGEISVESEWGVGSIFTVTLPCGEELE